MLAQFVDAKGYFYGITIDMENEKLVIDVIALEFSELPQAPLCSASQGPFWRSKVKNRKMLLMNRGRKKY